MNNNFDNFDTMLNQQAAISAGQKIIAKKQFEKINLSYTPNQGSYLIAPFNNPVTGFPFVQLYDTKEVCIPSKFIKDNVETVTNYWHKILPKDAYHMKDNTGRVVSSLSREDEIIWETANKLWRDLYSELGGFKKQAQRTQKEKEILDNTLRTKNYTLVNAYCISRLGDNNRGVIREKFCALFVIPAKGFMDILKKEIDEATTLDFQGDRKWLNGIYNDNTTSRDGYILFTITRPQTVYVCNIKHKMSPKQLEISEEDLEYLSKSPVENFLGKLAPVEEGVPNDRRHLFNSGEYKTIIEHLTNELAAIKAAKDKGLSIENAIATTNNAAMSANNSVTTAVQGSVDPMLNQMSTNSNQTVNPELIAKNNTTPFNNPPAAQIDPITGNPVSTSTAAPFSSPFGGQTQKTTDDLPF